MNSKGHILWADDEIDLLKPHILLLESKGYLVSPVNSGEDAIDICSNEKIDLVLLDEMMTGLDGLKTLKYIKDENPDIPIVMITKNEEEWFMEEAIAAQISNYLTKPVNPSQILIACKNILESRKIQSDRLAKDYLESFKKISFDIESAQQLGDWYSIVDILVDWSIKFDEFGDQGLGDLLEEQKSESNLRFTNYVEKEYIHFINSKSKPLMTTDVFSKFINPKLINDEKVVLIVLDCLRYDQWKAMTPILSHLFHIQTDHMLSILPTATPYSRNAIFSGLYPNELQLKYREIWDDMWQDEISMNRYEKIFLRDQMDRDGFENKSMKYIKISQYTQGNKLENRINDYKGIDLLALVINFVDILGHSRSKSKVLQEMVPDESAYRKAVCSWLENTWIIKVLEELSSWGHKIILTSDHGITKVNKPIKVKADRETSVGVRYKYGKNIKVNNKAGIIINDPASFKLPIHDTNSNYIIAKGNYFFVYPNDYNKFVKIYKNSFQHGGVSLEEMVLPIAIMEGKNN